MYTKNIPSSHKWQIILDGRINLHIKLKGICVLLIKIVKLSFIRVRLKFEIYALGFVQPSIIK